MKRTRILIFAKAPVPGRAKTRLVPALGEIGAARLAGQMLAATVAEAVAAGLSVPELCAEPHPLDPDWAPFLPAQALRLTHQGEGGLGERLARAARRVLLTGENVLLIGSDCPALDRGHLAAAAASLAAHDAVIHPAADGGYALLGLSRFDASLFEGIAWSTPAAFEQTRLRIAALGWSLDVREMLRDIDEPADLAALPEALRP